MGLRCSEMQNSTVSSVFFPVQSETHSLLNLLILVQFRKQSAFNCARMRRTSARSVRIFLVEIRSSRETIFTIRKNMNLLIVNCTFFSFTVSQTLF